MALLIRPVWLKGIRLRHVFVVSCGRQPWQPGEVVGGHRWYEAGPHPFDAAIDGLGHAANGFAPAEGEEEQTTIRGIVVPTQVDLIPAPLEQGLSGMAGGPSVDGGMWGLLRDMRG